MKQQNEEIADQAAKLDPARSQEDAVLVTSINNPLHDTHAGVVKEVTAKVAADLIAGGTHKLSTPEEIEAFRRR